MTKTNKPQITIADQDYIDEHPIVATHFFQHVLDMNYEDVLITDESQLSDFTGCNFERENPLPPIIFRGSLLDDKDGLSPSEKLKTAKEKAEKNPEYQKQKTDYQVFCTEWDGFMKQKINTLYGIEIANSHVFLFALFEKIHQKTLTPDGHNLLGNNDETENSAAVNKNHKIRIH